VNYHLQYEYGLTLAQYEEMLMTQCGTCAVCGESERALYKDTGEPKRLAVHHDHKTGAVVALVCQACNRGMGLLRDEPKLLRRAADLNDGR
jgi:Recombination endonuclease VII